MSQDFVPQVFNERFKPFVEQRPVCVMARMVLENLFNPQRLDALFKRTAKTQYTRELAFSTTVDLMGQVVLGISPSVHAAWQAQAQRLGVSDQSVYNKLNGLEPEVSAELVRDSAREAKALIEALRARLPPMLPGYHVKILDGNHLAATERRIKELRDSWAAPLPGQTLVVLDPELMLVDEIFLCQDGHAQERSMLGDVLQSVKANDLWIADRNFCTFDFLRGIDARKAAYVIRQHGKLNGTLLGVVQSCGKTATGKVCQQQLLLTHADGRSQLVRRITLRLNKPTRDGDREIHLLSNLPECKVSACQIAELYANRWDIENMFQELTCTLTCEIKTLGYPRAALFGFCLALVAYHAVSVIKAALRRVHGRETVAKKISGYYLSLELSQTYQGMMVAIPPSNWEKFREFGATELAELLEQLVGKIVLSRYQKHPRGPKKPPPEKSKYKNGGHLSTAKLIEKRVT